MINPANRVKSIELSQIRKMFEVTNPNAISLGIGEPDFDLPENIQKAINQCVKEGFTHYTPNKGFIELREEITKKLQNENNIQTTPDHVIVTCGASEALYCISQGLFEKSDHVLIPNPGFLSYEACVKLSEAKPIEVPAYMENGFKLKVEDVQEKIDSNTKAIILNSPSNPTGAVMDKKDIKGIGELATDHDFIIISDEIYEKIIYNKAKHYSPAEFSENVITINGFSKTYAMTGLRIAYMTGPEYLTEELLKVHQYCTACASSIAQKAGYEALTGPQDSVKEMVTEFEKRRNLITKRLKELGYNCPECNGAFYVFPEINNPIEFVEKTIEAGVITVPGIAFGSLGENHVRMSYANSYENIEKAMNIIESIQ